jgi:hypothetical protein
MLVNFGDNRNGNGTEEPKEQEGSFAPLETKPVVEEEPVKEIAKPEPPVEAKEKIITGKNEKIPVAKVEKAEKKLPSLPLRDQKSNEENNYRKY